ncbi:MAG TPA: hypothetical protein P5079_05490 [Elusimicrobiota bacterium]|nr:hypothetical protein [Elusimicrobiota bacterium]
MRKQNMKRRFSLAALAAAGVFVFAALPLRAESGLVTWLVDTPTAEIVDHYGYNLGFRLYSGGGVLTKGTFGVFPRLNVGFGLDAEKFIGADTVDLNPPTLNAKFRLFDGKRYLPALALGYDGQGYFYDHSTDKYLQREKGLYLVGGEEVFTPGLTLTGGANIYDFSDDRIYAFAGVNYVYENFLGVVFELDNVHGKPRTNRMNAGVRCFVTPSVSVDVSGRDLWAASRKAERIVVVNYIGSF